MDCGRCHSGWIRDRIIIQTGSAFQGKMCNPQSVGIHPAPFPVKLAKDHIISWSNKGDIVLDPFMGSGSTAIACIDAKRHFVGFEISDEYCKSAEERIEKHKRSILQGQMSIDDLLSGGENGKA